MIAFHVVSFFGGFFEFSPVAEAFKGYAYVVFSCEAISGDGKNAQSSDRQRLPQWR